jgi:hypothetical protein
MRVELQFDVAMGALVGHLGRAGAPGARRGGRGKRRPVGAAAKLAEE